MSRGHSESMMSAKTEQAIAWAGASSSAMMTMEGTARRIPPSLLGSSACMKLHEACCCSGRDEHDIGDERNQGPRACRHGVRGGVKRWRCAIVVRRGNAGDVGARGLATTSETKGCVGDVDKRESEASDGLPSPTQPATRVRRKASRRQDEWEAAPRTPPLRNARADSPSRQQ
eukprot:5700606-Pleurochrysis_carterae.AAC.2